MNINKKIKKLKKRRKQIDNLIKLLQAFKPK